MNTPYPLSILSRLLLAVAMTLLLAFNWGCNQRPSPTGQPSPFLAGLVPGQALIHRGVFSNDLQQYYTTVSDTAFEHFQVLVSHRTAQGWGKPQPAFFNSPYNDHGMSFSPNGQTLVFSSTRPVGDATTAGTWQLWRCQKRGGQWGAPEHVPIPNLAGKLVSHPTLAPDGTLYFHASAPDYTGMAIYMAPLENGQYQAAQKVALQVPHAIGYCTPFVAANGAYLLFAAIGSGLELYVCPNNGQGQWLAPIKLPAAINTNGQGNPYLTPDLQQLLYASENKTTGQWQINSVGTASFLGQAPK